MEKYFDIAFTPPVTELQTLKGAREHYSRAAETWPNPIGLDTGEIGHIQAADSFYMASVSDTEWPYVQHRGGSRGFVKVIDDHTIGWVERLGNRQYVSAGNIAANNKVAIIIVDYPSRTRLKLFGLATHHLEPPSDLIDTLGGNDTRRDGAITVDVVSFDWNCPKFITPRFTQEHVDALTGPLRQHIRELEAELEGHPQTSTHEEGAKQ